MTDYTQLRKLATEAIHWDFHCDNPDCGCTDSMSAFADAANPKAVIELLDEIERLKKDAERYRWLASSAYPEDGISIQWHQENSLEEFIDEAISKMESTGIK